MKEEEIIFGPGIDMFGGSGGNDYGFNTSYVRVVVGDFEGGGASVGSRLYLFTFKVLQ